MEVSNGNRTGAPLQRFPTAHNPLKALPTPSRPPPYKGALVPVLLLVGEAVGDGWGRLGASLIPIRQNISSCGDPRSGAHGLSPVNGPHGTLISPGWHWNPLSERPTDQVKRLKVGEQLTSCLLVGWAGDLILPGGSLSHVLAEFAFAPLETRERKAMTGREKRVFVTL